MAPLTRASGGQLHLLAPEDDHNVGTLHEWHDAQHRQEHEDESPGDDQPPPKGLQIELPRLLATAASGSTAAAAASVQVLALLPLSGLGEAGNPGTAMDKAKLVVPSRGAASLGCRAF